jgi:hypothetical protein
MTDQNTNDNQKENLRFSNSFKAWFPTNITEKNIKETMKRILKKEDEYKIIIKKAEEHSVIVWKEEVEVVSRTVFLHCTDRHVTKLKRPIIFNVNSKTKERIFFVEYNTEEERFKGRIIIYHHPDIVTSTDTILERLQAYGACGFSDTIKYWKAGPGRIVVEIGYRRRQDRTRVEKSLKTEKIVWESARQSTGLYLLLTKEEREKKNKERTTQKKQEEVHAKDTTESMVLDFKRNEKRDIKDTWESESDDEDTEHTKPVKKPVVEAGSETAE